ncbi:MAG: hypothetical protein HFI67_12040 [Lachnospiraceae bacterium]|jgi:phi13 family phage major tail protein|nr:hypothetical protein [Lachnospiraceae bacterium]
MAAFGAKYINFAPITEEPKGSLPVYGERVKIGELVKADLTVNISTGELYADNRLKEKADEFISGSLAVEVDDMTKEIEAGVYGATYKEGEIIDNSEDNVPYGGLGYYKTLQRDGARVYEAYYYPKVKAVLGTDSAATKGSSITFTTKALTFTVHEPDTGDWRYRKEFSDEAEAAAYVDGKLGNAPEGAENQRAGQEETV